MSRSLPIGKRHRTGDGMYYMWWPPVPHPSQRDSCHWLSGRCNQSSMCAICLQLTIIPYVADRAVSQQPGHLCLWMRASTARPWRCATVAVRVVRVAGLRRSVYPTSICALLCCWLIGTTTTVWAVHLIPYCFTIAWPSRGTPGASEAPGACMMHVCPAVTLRLAAAELSCNRALERRAAL